MEPGYYRDSEVLLYRSTTGQLWVVADFSSIKPIWAKTGCLSSDATRIKDDPTVLARVEKNRRAHLVPA